MTWEELEEQCRNCTKCPLHETRTNCVFGTGDRNADVLFVGEAPGEKEDLSGIPFVGAAGKLLDKYLEAVDIDRSRVYIANMLNAVRRRTVTPCSRSRICALTISVGRYA